MQMRGGMQVSLLCNTHLLPQNQMHSVPSTTRGLVLVFCEPTCSSPLLPLAIALFASCCGVGTSSVLFAVLPLALVLPAIGPLEDTRSLLLVIVVLALVAAPIAPRE